MRPGPAETRVGELERNIQAQGLALYSPRISGCRNGLSAHVAPSANCAERTMLRPRTDVHAAMSDATGKGATIREYQSVDRTYDRAALGSLKSIGGSYIPTTNNLPAVSLQKRQSSFRIPEEGS